MFIGSKAVQQLQRLKSPCDPTLITRVDTEQRKQTTEIIRGTLYSQLHS